jgi:RNA polymerase sigma factor (sigma-70 family)
MSSSWEDPNGPEGTREIVRRAREEGAAGFRALYERIAPSLHAWIRLRSAAKSVVHGDPEDVLQEIWLRAVEEFPSYDPARSGFRAWIFGIAKNVLYEAWRQESRRGHPLPAGERSAALQAWPDVATTIRTRMARDDSMGRFLKRAQEFDPTDRMLLLHCGFEDMSRPQAARQLGIAAEAAEKRWQRLRAWIVERNFVELLELRETV